MNPIYFVGVVGIGEYAIGLTFYRHASDEAKRNAALAVLCSVLKCSQAEVSRIQQHVPLNMEEWGPHFSEGDYPNTDPQCHFLLWKRPN
ncbi:MAG: hypothetical protein JO331_03680 [Verrucomicrobia bacterium]|nr:hypothetical protein [Verrucomicrobiota bacterium]